MNIELTKESEQTPYPIRRIEANGHSATIEIDNDGDAEIRTSFPNFFIPPIIRELCLTVKDTGALYYSARYRYCCNVKPLFHEQFMHVAANALTKYMNGLFSISLEKTEVSYTTTIQIPKGKSVSMFLGQNSPIVQANAVIFTKKNDDYTITICPNNENEPTQTITVLDTTTQSKVVGFINSLNFLKKYIVINDYEQYTCFNLAVCIGNI